MILNNVCTGCGGELIYDAKSGELKCVNCSSIVDIPEQNIILHKRELLPTTTIKASKTKYAQYHCSTCGRSHIMNVNGELLSCPSCGDSNLTRTLNVEYMPDGIIPFKLNKEEAKNCFKRWIKKCKFAPFKLAEKAASYNFSGVYLPSYLYNFYTSTTYSGVGVTSYTTSNNVNGVPSVMSHQDRECFSGTRKDDFFNYIHTANSEISTDILKKIANFNFNEACVYRPEFLYGWVGSEVNIPLENSVNMAKNDVSFTVERRVKSSYHYDSIENFSCNTVFEKCEFNYLYLPIWSCNYKYKNNTYNFFINGVTGKIHGKSPKSKGKIATLSVFIAGIIGTLGFIIIKFLLGM